MFLLSTFLVEGRVWLVMTIVGVIVLISYRTELHTCIELCSGPPNIIDLIWSLFLQRVSFWVYHLCQIEKLSSGKKKQLYTLPGTNVWYPIHPGSCKDKFPAFPIWWEIHFPNRTYPKIIIFGSRNTFSKLKFLGGLWSTCEGFIYPGHAGRLHGKVPEPLDVVCTFLMVISKVSNKWMMTGVGKGERYAPYTNSSQKDNPTVLSIAIACIVIQIKNSG